MRRLRGYRRALADRGIDLTDDRVVTGPASFVGGMAAFNRALDAGSRFTAVLAMSDAMAIGALHAARERGLRVPEDVSLVGFDNIDEAEHTHPHPYNRAPAGARKGRGGSQVAAGGGRSPRHRAAGTPAPGDAADHPRLDLSAGLEPKEVKSPHLTEGSGRVRPN